MSRSISSIFIDSMSLKHMKFALAKVVLEIIFSYLMGSQSYAKTYAALRHYKVHRSFSRTLRSLSYSDIEYVMNVLRKYVASFDSWDYDPKLETKVRPRDRYWFSRLSSKLKVNYVPTWPSESYILENMKFSVHKTAIQCQRTLKGADGGATHEDLVSELTLKVMSTYRLYIYSYSEADQGFNGSVLYQCLHLALQTWAKDYIKHNIKAIKVAGRLMNQSMNLQDSSVTHDSGETICAARQAVLDDGLLSKVQQQVLISDLFYLGA